VSTSSVPSGYAKVEIKLNTSGRGAFELGTASNQTFAEIHAAVTQDVRKYLAAGDTDNLCPMKDNSLNKGPGGAGRMSGMECEKALVQKTAPKILEASLLLGNVQKGIIGNDSKLVNAAFLKLGKLVMHNRFTVQHYLKWVRLAGKSTFAMLLEGEHSQRVQILR